MQKKRPGLVWAMAVIMMLALLAVSFTACRTATVSEEAQAVIKLVDGLGNEVVLDEPAEEVIVFVPSALEIIDAIGAMDKVIGVDNWSIDMGDPLAEGMEGFGDFQGLNMEKVTAADPDIIIGLVGWVEADLQKLADLGIKLYIVDANTIDEVYTEIENMGAILGKQEEAKKIRDDLKEQIDAVTEKVAGLTDDEKPEVFYEVWNDPIMSAGNDTFINELIEYAGGINIVAADGLEGWPEYSVEKLIQNDPDVIIAPMSLAPDAAIILSDERFSEVKAVIDGRVYIVPDNPVSRPSQNLIKGLEMVARALHPEIFGEFNVLQ
jgi:iron complex transport system substrate-binding protein